MTNSIQSQSESDVTVFAETNYRNAQAKFGIKRSDRLAHIYLLGKTGTGKSTLLETFMLDDLKKGYGLALLDPHGDLVKKLYKRALFYRQSDLIYFDASNLNQPFGFNRKI